MVPVIANSDNPLLRDVYNTLVQQRKLASDFSVEGAFAAWIDQTTDGAIPTCSFDDLVVSNYHHVSIVGFVMETDPVANSKLEAFLIDGLKRVAGRTITILDSEPAPFRHDAIALVGLALGARRIGGDVEGKVQQWMRAFINPGDNSSPPWKRVLYFATLAIVGEKLDLRVLHDISDVRDLQLALVSRGINIFSEIDSNLAYQEICKSATKVNLEPVIAACSLAALEYLTSNSQILSINKPTIQQLIQLLNRIPAGLKRWPWEDKPLTKTGTLQRWDIQNEYHVQSLIYSLLAPLFTDIEDEFYFEPIGQLNPRADIGIPSLSIIIEIKFLRDTKPFGKLIEEIAADASLYFKKDSVFAKKYSRMIVVLWDNSSRSQHHAEFIKGVNQLPNVSGSVVISRPGNMTIQHSEGLVTTKAGKGKGKK
jgi:hypothetical protein